MELHWNIRLAEKDGPTVLRGKTELSGRGELHLRPSLPEGHLEEVSALLHLPLRPGEKVFMNGYQTWTNCPELGPKDRLRGLNGLPKAVVEHFSLNSYGDYDFVPYPDRPGQSHGFSYCSFRLGERTRLFASLDEKPGYTVFSYDAGQALLRIERDCRGLRCGGEYRALDLFYAEGTEDEVFDAWFQALGLPAPKARPLKGYSSWYNRYEAIDDGCIRSDLSGCKTLLEPGDLFQIDDGWESAVGDWEPDGKKFPQGLKGLAEEIHAAGFLAGLWLAPFAAKKDSELVRQHPDWLLRDEIGGLWTGGVNWGGFYALDIDRPAVQEYLKQVFDKVLLDWGFDLVKLDFLYAAAPFAGEKETRGGRMCRAMELLRRLCGEKLILGCGVPLMPAFGLVDYCRIGCDVSLDWDDKPYMRLAHRERVSTKQAIENSFFRRPLNGRAFLNDPDVFFLREENLKLSQSEKLLLAKANALLGGLLLTSDDPNLYGDKQRETYREIVRLFGAEEVRAGAEKGCIRYRLDGKEQLLKLPKGKLKIGK